MFLKRKRVPTYSLEEGHIYWLNNGNVVDLGPASVEDLRLAAYVTQEARIRLPGRKTSASIATLTRVDSFIKKMYKKAKDSVDN